MTGGVRWPVLHGRRAFQRRAAPETPARGPNMATTAAAMAAAACPGRIPGYRTL